jgi:hypothetical protein
MNSDRRTLELLFQDLITDWGELHDQVKAARLNAQSCVELVYRLENMIDTKHTQLMSTINEQLERQQTLDV